MPPIAWPTDPLQILLAVLAVVGFFIGLWSLFLAFPKKAILAVDLSYFSLLPREDFRSGVEVFVKGHKFVDPYAAKVTFRNLGKQDITLEDFNGGEITLDVAGAKTKSAAGPTKGWTMDVVDNALVVHGRLLKAGEEVTLQFMLDGRGADEWKVRLPHVEVLGTNDLARLRHRRQTAAVATGGGMASLVIGVSSYLSGNSDGTLFLVVGIVGSLLGSWDMHKTRGIPIDEPEAYPSEARTHAC